MYGKQKQVTQWVGLLCLSGLLQGLPATLKADTLVVPSVNQQDAYTLRGTVVDESGVPIIGANVLVKGTTQGVVTDIDGKFAIEVSPNSILQVSYIGYASLEYPCGGKRDEGEPARIGRGGRRRLRNDEEERPDRRRVDHQGGRDHGLHRLQPHPGVARPRAGRRPLAKHGRPGGRLLDTHPRRELHPRG